MAFDMMEGIEVMVDPGTGGGIEMRIGCHSGSVVSGVVGLKMPRLVKSAVLRDFITITLSDNSDHNRFSQVLSFRAERGPDRKVRVQLQAHEDPHIAALQGPPLAAIQVR